MFWKYTWWIAKSIGYWTLYFLASGFASVDADRPPQRPRRPYPYDKSSA
ncbi:hypothetical protein [Nocardia sp. NPDC052566]